MILYEDIHVWSSCDVSPEWVHKCAYILLSVRHGRPWCLCIRRHTFSYMAYLIRDVHHTNSYRTEANVWVCMILLLYEWEWSHKHMTSVWMNIIVYEYFCVWIFMRKHLYDSVCSSWPVWYCMKTAVMYVVYEVGCICVFMPLYDVNLRMNKYEPHPYVYDMKLWCMIEYEKVWVSIPSVTQHTHTGNKTHLSPLNVGSLMPAF